MRWIVCGLGLLLPGCADLVGAEAPAESTSSGSPSTTGDDSSSGVPSTTSMDPSGGGSTTDLSATGAIDPDSSEDGTTSTTAAGTGTGTGRPPSSCGDMVVDADEDCDDANTDELDGCTQSCVFSPLGLSFGATTQTGVAGGGNMNSINVNVDECPPGQVLTGLQGTLTADPWLGRIGGVCRPAELENVAPAVFITSDPITALPVHGQFNAGGPWQTQCLPNQAVIGVRAWVGDVMDGIEIRCADTQTAGPPGAHTLDPAPTNWLGAQGDTGTGDGLPNAGPLTCPPGTLATGLEAHTNSYVVRVGLRCSEVNLDYGG